MTRAHNSFIEGSCFSISLADLTPFKAQFYTAVSFPRKSTNLTLSFHQTHTRKKGKQNPSLFLLSQKGRRFLARSRIVTFQRDSSISERVKRNFSFVGNFQEQQSAVCLPFFTAPCHLIDIGM